MAGQPAEPGDSCYRWRAERAVLPSHTDTEELQARAAWHVLSCPDCAKWPRHTGLPRDPDWR